MFRVPSLSVAALISTAVMGAPAWGAACVSAPVATYTAAGFSCNVEGITFSGISVLSTVTGSGVVTLGNFTPYNFGGEFGLSLNYTALAPDKFSTADVAWQYNIVGVPNINDAFLALTGSITGAGFAQVSETLSNGVVLSLNAPGSTSTTFAPTPSLHIFKDQINFVGTAGGTSATSILTNAFSVVPVPAALPLFAAGLGVLGLLGRRRKQRKALASA